MHIQQLSPFAGQPTALTPLRVTTVQPSRWKQLSIRMKETGLGETVTEVVLATTTFSLVGGMLFSLYRALECYTIVPLR